MNTNGMAMTSLKEELFIGNELTYELSLYYQIT